MEPRLGENDKVSRVRFSSSTLSLLSGGSGGGTGRGSVVGDAVLSGRKMVLKPWPLNVPAKATSGPRLGAEEATALGAVRFDTSLILKPLGSEKAVSRLMSVMVPPPIGPAPGRIGCRS